MKGGPKKIRRGFEEKKETLNPVRPKLRSEKRFQILGETLIIPNNFSVIFSCLSNHISVAR